MDEQQPLFRMDERPPDSYGLNYIGYFCKSGRHEQCVGWWEDSVHTGKGTRCACLCHEGEP
jgi:hypothetical protein